jgi:C-terminal processing protease CtpA/Prc
MLRVLDTLLLATLLAAQLTPAELRTDLDALARDVPRAWSYWEDRTASGIVDPESWLDDARAACRTPRSRAEFALILRRAVADLCDGHAGLRVEGDDVATRVLPFSIRETANGAAIVDSVIPCADAGPELGDRLIAIDGEPVEEGLARELEVVFASTAPSRRRAAWRRLLRTGGETCTVTLLAPDGTRRELELHTVIPTSSDEPNWSLSWPRPDVARLRVRGFHVERWSEWLAAEHQDREGFLTETRETIARLFRELDERSPRALVLDVRGNGGGTDLLGIYLAEHLLEGTFRYFLLSSFLDGHWAEARGLPYGGRTDVAPYRGPVVALIDEGCFSTTDNLLRCLDDLHPDFTVVGRPSGGGTGAPRVVSTLPVSGAKITLCTQRVYGPLGKLTEGRGTQPDLPVAWTREDILAGRDPDLERALRVLDERATEQDR